MKKWGVVVALFYCLVITVLVVPAALLLVATSPPSMNDFRALYANAITWVLVGIVTFGEILLLWLTVDTTQKRLKPRTHIVVSAATTGALLAIVTIAIIFSIGVAARGDGILQILPNSPNIPAILGAFCIPWLVWAILFYRVCRNSSDPITRAIVWILRGSVLELLIAVPAHVIVRRRNDCSAPVVTGFGLASGLAIMLISFGPSVLWLYKKRMESYPAKSASAK